MFTSMQLDAIDPGYFKIIELSPLMITVKSKNTGHSWQIEAKSETVFVLRHKHRDSQPFHWQTTVATLEDALDEIYEHDEFQMNGRHAAFPVYTREGIVIYRNGRCFSKRY